MSWSTAAPVRPHGRWSTERPDFEQLVRAWRVYVMHDAALTAPELAASASVLVPNVSLTTAVAGAPLMASVADMAVPGVAVGMTVPAEVMGAAAVLNAPSMGSAVVVHVPASGDSFPHEFPWQFDGPNSSLAAAAQMLAPAVSVGPNVAEVPTMTAAAVVDEPGVASGTTVSMPDGAGGDFPHQFPHLWGDPVGSMHAVAALDVPVVSADVVVSAVLMTAAAGISDPGVMSGVAAALAVMQASAEALAPVVDSGAAVAVPVMDAATTTLTPSAESGAGVDAPVMGAGASASAPSVDVTVIDFIVDAPVMTAAASMVDADLVMVAEVPVMQASAKPDGFPFQFPRLFETAGIYAPAVSVDAFVSAVLMAASADAAIPGVLATVAVAAVVMQAAAAAATPSAASGAASGVPRSAAAASANVPDLVWTQPPITTPFTSSSTFDVSAVRGWATHLVLVGIGGAEAGTNGSFATGIGGAAGSWNNTTIDLAAYPLLTSLTVTVGAAGASNGADGGATTISGNGGMPTLTCAGGSGNTGLTAGGNPGNTTVDGDTYTGGSGGVAAGTAGTAPGGGGAGGNFFSAGGAGARGGAWIKAKRI